VRSRLPSPWVVAALGAVLYLLVAPPSADLAAQEYRAELGLTLWNNGWFAGHHTPGYSVLFPPLGGLLGVRLTGAVAAVAAAALFTALARRHWGEPTRESEGFWVDVTQNPSRSRRGDAAALWFAAGTIAVLLTGRMTFLLGVAIGLGALLALAHERRLLAVALAAVTTLASPVAGLFLALAAVAWALAAARERAPAGAGIAAAALAPVALMLVAFPQGGSEPFVASAFWPALAGAALLGALMPAHERALRNGALLYALALVAAFALATPLGGNATRLGALVAGPVALGALLGRRHPAVVAALAVAFAYWPLYPALRDVVRASGDPSIEASYHAPLLTFLRTQGPRNGFRVEIPFTENHWEARHVPAGPDGVPLARGWERQLDRRFGALFYDGSLDARGYRRWLDERAVAFVAVPDVPLDAAGRAEARLIEDGLPFLRPVWHDAHWRVFAVARPAPLAQDAAGARATATLSPAGVTVRAARAGSVLVRVHFTRWWRVTAGRGCVSEAPGGMTRVRLPAAGTVTLRARLTGSACRR
jgi:fumarate reductase subunit D